MHIFVFSRLSWIVEIVQINCWCNISYAFSLKLSFTVTQKNSYDEATALLLSYLEILFAAQPREQRLLKIIAFVRNTGNLKPLEFSLSLSNSGPYVMLSPGT